LTQGDVSGGNGAFLSLILQAYPALHGILFDLPHIAALAGSTLAEEGVADRCLLVGGDFFEGVPGGGDVYVLSVVVHDWDDQRARCILGNCRQVVPPDGKLLIVETLMPERVEQAPSVILNDLVMLAHTGGKQRTEAEHGQLLAYAGFSLTRNLPAADTAGPSCSSQPERARASASRRRIFA